MKRLLAATVAIFALYGVLTVILAVLDDKDPTAAISAWRQAEVETLTTRAQQGDAGAQFALAQRYHQGTGAEKDLPKAARYYEAAAKKGHVEAQYTLGRMYAEGEGVKSDYHRASEWYTLAASIGRNRDAQYALGELYYNGRGVLHDINEAIAWWQRAAERGHPAAQYLMGIVYEEGWGVERDYIAALTWFTLASTDAERVRSFSPKFKPVARRDTVTAKMNRFQIGQAKKRIAAWSPER
jgi:TPR repeat protein